MLSVKQIIPHLVSTRDGDRVINIAKRFVYRAIVKWPRLGRSSVNRLVVVTAAGSPALLARSETEPTKGRRSTS